MCSMKKSAVSARLFGTPENEGSQAWCLTLKLPDRWANSMWGGSGNRVGNVSAVGGGL